MTDDLTSYSDYELFDWVVDWYGYETAIDLVAIRCHEPGFLLEKLIADYKEYYGDEFVYDAPCITAWIAENVDPLDFAEFIRDNDTLWQICKNLILESGMLED